MGWNGAFDNSSGLVVGARGSQPAHGLVVLRPSARKRPQRIPYDWFCGAAMLVAVLSGGDDGDGWLSRPTRRRAWGSHFAEVLQHALGVAFGLDVLPDVADAPVGADVEGGARHAHEFLALHTLFDPDAVALGDL